MAQSREQLTMDNAKSDSMFKRPNGCYVTRTKAFGFILLVALLAVAVGFITYNMTPCRSSILKTQDPNVTADSSHGSRVTDVLLPTNVRPLYYKVDLIPYIDPVKNFSIDGKVSIHILCLQETKRVTIHVKNVTVHATTVSLEKIEEDRNATNFNVVNQEYDIPRDFFNVTFDRALSPGVTYRLHMEFEAILGDELAGFYRSSYMDIATNQTR